MVNRVAGRQWRVIHQSQLLKCGLSSSAISRWVASGHLYRRYPSVYTVGGAELSVEGELAAALLACGPGAALSYATAAWWWGLSEEQPRLIDVSVPRRRSAPDGIRVHHASKLRRVRHRRLPVTPVLDTLVDFAATASVRVVKRALAEADFHQLIDLDALRAAIPPRRPGVATLKEALALHLPELARTRSRVEADFLELCQRAGLPTPMINTRLHGYLVDAVWPGQRVVVELDGLHGHRTRAQLQRDHQRDLVLRAHGYTVLRYTYQQVTERPDEVAADLQRALYQR